MTLQGYGYAVTDYGSAWELDRKLSELVEVGFTHAEIRPEGWQVWRDERIDNRTLARLSAVLDKHRSQLDYVMQLPMAVNLFDLTQPQKHRQLLQQGVTVAAHIGAKMLLYQPGYRTDLTKTDFIAMSHLMDKERAVLSSLADEVAVWDAQIVIQTPNYLAGNCATYAVWPDLLAQQVQQIDHPHLGLCLDFNQVYLMADWVGFNYVEAIQRLLPVAQHFHVQDVEGVLAELASVDVALMESVTYLPSGWHQQPFPVTWNQIPHLSTTLTLLEQEAFLPDPKLAMNSDHLGLPQTAVTA